MHTLGMDKKICSYKNHVQNDISNCVAMPAISIVMSACNEEQSIGKAIESIIAQTFEDWELIIINDGSIDRTDDVIRQFTDIDPRIHTVLNETNLGLPACLNKGIELSRSNLIARADADDVNMPERLAKQYEYMQSHSDIDVLGTGAYLFDKQRIRTTAVSLPQTHIELEQLSFLKTHFFHPSVMIRKGFFDRVGGYDESYLRAQDKELWLRGLSAGCHYANLPEPLIYYSTNGYIRSWQSINNRTISLLQIVQSYRIKWGYILVIISFTLSAAIKLHIYKPSSIR